jgi:hypothetical protein
MEKCGGGWRVRAPFIGGQEMVVERLSVMKLATTHSNDH